MRRLSASAMPRAFACPPSVAADEGIQITVSNDAGNAGSAAHEAMERIVDGAWPDYDQIAARWGIEVKELRKLTWFGTKAWEELASSFPDARSEVSVHLQAPKFLLRCRIDLSTPLAAAAVNVLDWKFGRVDADYYHQLAAEAACLILAPGSVVQRVTGTLVWARDQQVETYRFDRDACEKWITDVENRVLGRTQYRTGKQCTYCPRTHSCEAVIAMAKRDTAIFSNAAFKETVETGLQNLTSEQIVDMIRRGKTVTTFFNNFKDAVLRHVEKNGPLDSGDGHEIRVVEENGAREIDVTKAWPILSQALTPAEMAPIVSISASRMDTAVAKKAGHGYGAEAKRDLQERLVAADAITQKTISKMKEVRKPKEPA